MVRLPMGETRISANRSGVVTNVFEAVDVITLIKEANYDDLNLNVGEALQKRPEVRAIAGTSK